MMCEQALAFRELNQQIDVALVIVLSSSHRAKDSYSRHIISLTDLNEFADIERQRRHRDSPSELYGHGNSPAQGRELPQAFDRTR